jgi:hypothetical protein
VCKKEIKKKKKNYLLEPFWFVAFPMAIPHWAVPWTQNGYWERCETKWLLGDTVNQKISW